jgi:hypothetical protein
MNHVERARAENPIVVQLLATLFLAALALVLVWPVVKHPSWWLWKPGAPASDLTVTHWPNAQFTRRMLWQEGRFPVWRPTIMSGVPFAANPLTGLYYPLNWLLLFLPWLPLSVGFNVSAVVHLVLAGVAMKMLMERGLGAGFWGGLLAGAAYEASPKLLAHLGAGHVGWAQAWAWLPVVLLCAVELCRTEGRRRLTWSAAGGSALAIQFCADVRLAAYTVIATGLLIAAYALSAPGFDGGSPATGMLRQLRDRIRNLAGPGLLFAAVFLGLAACQWLPAAALLPDTTRTAMTLSDGAVWSLPWRYLAGLVLADHGGFHEWMTYVGLSTAMLAGVGARALWRDHERRWLAVWLAVLIVFAAWFSLGQHGGLFPLLWRLVPGLSLLRVPPRAWTLVAFSTAVGAGVGLKDLLHTPRRSVPGPARWGGHLLIAVGILPPTLVAGYALTFGSPPLNLVSFGLIAPLTAGIIGQFQSPMRESGPLRLVLASLVVLLVAVDLLIADGTLVTARPQRDVFAEGGTVAEWLADQPGRFRVYSPSYSIPQHVAEAHGLALADGVDPLQLRVYARYLTRAAGLPSRPAYSVTLPPFPEGSDVEKAFSDVRPDPDLLGQLGVQYVAAAFPLPESDSEDDAFRLMDRMDGVFLYRNSKAKRAAPPRGTAALVLADGTVLHAYQGWPLIVGGTISAATVLALGVGAIVTWMRREDG